MELDVLPYLTLVMLKPKFCLIYIDDIVIYSKDVDEHFQHLKMVFSQLRAARLKLKPSKCEFYHAKLEYLGHVISSDGVRTNPKKVEAVKSWPHPSTVMELQSFLRSTASFITIHLWPILSINI